MYILHKDVSLLNRLKVKNSVVTDYKLVVVYSAVHSLPADSKAYHIYVYASYSSHSARLAYAMHRS